jgi:hypothetical protein
MIDLPMVSMLNIVPTTAMSRIVPRWSKNNRFGIKYPASRIMGGSMKRKKVSGVSVVGTLSLVRMRRKPIIMPTTMRRQDSGKMLGNLGVMWKPKKRGK